MYDFTIRLAYGFRIDFGQTFDDKIKTLNDKLGINIRLIEDIHTAIAQKYGFGKLIVEEGYDDPYTMIVLVKSSMIENEAEGWTNYDHVLLEKPLSFPAEYIELRDILKEIYPDTQEGWIFSSIWES